jgi:D-alanyl-lipoteichoic acid acyltransferase DltB (MBOAT superfamily)
MAFIPIYILVLVALIVIDYCVAIMIEGSSGRTRTYYLLVSIAGLVTTLGTFKYFNFFNANIALLASAFHVPNYPIAMLTLALPIGLSFHTFQSLSYVLEVYHGRQKAERHLGIFSLYVMFYPNSSPAPSSGPNISSINSTSITFTIMIVSRPGSYEWHGDFSRKWSWPTG